MENRIDISSIVDQSFDDLIYNYKIIDKLHITQENKQQALKIIKEELRSKLMYDITLDKKTDDFTLEDLMKDKDLPQEFLKLPAADFYLFYCYVKDMIKNEHMNKICVYEASKNMYNYDKGMFFKALRNDPSADIKLIMERMKK